MSITTRTARYWLDEEGFVRGEVLAGADEGLEDSIEAVKVFESLCAGTPRPLLINLTGARSISREARRTYGDPAMANSCTAIALVAGSPISRALGNFFLGLTRPAIPTRLFSTEEEGLAWLREQTKARSEEPR